MLAVLVLLAMLAMLAANPPSWRNHRGAGELPKLGGEGSNPFRRSEKARSSRGLEGRAVVFRVHRGGADARVMKKSAAGGVLAAMDDPFKDGAKEGIKGMTFVKCRREQMLQPHSTWLSRWKAASRRLEASATA